MILLFYSYSSIYPMCYSNNNGIDFYLVIIASYIIIIIIITTVIIVLKIQSIENFHTSSSMGKN